MAPTSAVMSMAAGHHVIQRPQPTHPEVPNWSTHEASLWVAHWRYRDGTDERTLPPCRWEKSLVKQESHTRHRWVPAPERSLTSSREGGSEEHTPEFQYLR